QSLPVPLSCRLRQAYQVGDVASDRRRSRRGDPWGGEKDGQAVFGPEHVRRADGPRYPRVRNETHAEALQEHRQHETDYLRGEPGAEAHPCACAEREVRVEGGPDLLPSRGVEAVGVREDA